MSITNEDRYDLQTKANDVLGQKEGATLMELLPPVGWADVATKRDLDQLEERIDRRFESVDQRFDAIVQTIKIAMAEQTAALQTFKTAMAEQNAAIKTAMAEQNAAINTAMAEQNTAMAEQNAAHQTDMQKKHGVLLSVMVSLATLITAILSITIAIAT